MKRSDPGRSSGSGPGAIEYPASQVPTVWIDDPAGLAGLIETLHAEPAYALDTEFHRERTYYPKVALVQIAWPAGIALVDPLAVDIAPLASVLDGPGLCVVHAAQQDLEVLSRSCGTIPARIFDTQVAAGFLGHSSPSLTSLVSGELHVHLTKGDRLTDWLARPLSDDQCRYAASDVAHLLELHTRLCRQLETRGRLQWAEDECEVLRSRPVGPGDPLDAWLRLKDVRTLKGAARGVAREICAWRERRASELDQPVRFVLPDLAVLSIAQRAPRTVETLRSVRGVEDRHSRGKIVEQILDAVAKGVAEPVEAPVDRDENLLDRRLRPAVTLVSAWISQLARDSDIDTALLATRADLVSLLAGDLDGRLSVGWRAELVGDRVRRLVDGHAALAFDGKGGLRLIDLPPEVDASTL
jgi:ribonuclease D